MINFRNDYSQIAHPSILKALSDSCLYDNEGYGLDEYSKKASNIIKDLLCDKSIDVHFMMNGTGTNKTVLSHILRPYQAVISCDTGHINVHETGAVESTGHKVIVCNGINGKLDSKLIEQAFYNHTDEHMVMPKAVYVSNATETGNIYTFSELKSIRQVCNKLNLYLYMDGARLGVAMQSEKNDVKWCDLCSFFDAFCIGGTKNGAMLGEAVVICNEELKKDFRYSIKNGGGMYAKGFIIGIEFYELFRDGLYSRLAKNANEMAHILKKGLITAGYKMEYDSYTNQIFVIVNRKQAEGLSEHIVFETIYKRSDDEVVIRFVTGFATTEKQVMDALKILEELNR
ncbi:MAG: beta-eliminating lyase-related protein [Clostridia bacterium]|jgi:threonine aldolase